MSTDETTRKTFADASSDVERPDSNDSDELEKLDYNGLPLVPQPSRFKDDPLVSIDGAHLRLSWYMNTDLTTCRIGHHGSNGPS
jgi:hypothetical protein